MDHVISFILSVLSGENCFGFVIKATSSSDGYEQKLNKKIEAKIMEIVENNFMNVHVQCNFYLLKFQFNLHLVLLGSVRNRVWLNRNTHTHTHTQNCINNTSKIVLLAEVHFTWLSGNVLLNWEQSEWRLFKVKKIHRVAKMNHFTWDFSRFSIPQMV